MQLRPVARVCGAFSIALGVAIVVGWILDVWLLTGVAPSLPKAAPNSAFMFVACGLVLVLENAGARRRWARPASTGAALFVVALSGLTLVEHAADVDLGINARLGGDFGELEHPGRPATHTAAAFLLLGCCLLLTRWRTNTGAVVSGVLGAGAAAVVGLAIAGYLVGVDYLYGSSSAHGMSAHTAVGLVVVLTGVFALRPEVPPAAWYSRAGAGEAAARRLMVPGLVVPFVAGGLVQGGALLGLYTERFATSLLIVVFAASIQLLIFVAVRVVGSYERERREQVQRFTKLAGRAPVGIFETDPDGKVTYLNERWGEITGMSELDFIGGGSVVHPDDREQIRAEWAAAAKAGRDFRREFRFLRPDGDVRWVSVHASGLRDEQGELTGFIGSALDITERRTAEERTELIVSRIAEAVAVIGPDGSYLHVNASAAALLDDLGQRSREGSVGDFSWAAVDTDGSPVSNDQLPAEITRTTGVEVDGRVLGFPGRGGDMRWLRISSRRLSDDGPPYTIVVSSSDVSAQRKADARLADARKRFELAFDHAPIGVSLVSLEGQLLRVNRALCEMLEYDEEELLATTYQQLTDPEDLEVDIAQLRRLVAGEIPSYQTENRYLRKDESQLWALVSVALVRDDDDKPLYFIAQILDVTERRRLERQLRHQAEHDMLTGLANRRVFGAELARQLARERRYGGESSLMLIDLDGFKEVNDTHGHAVGDLVLQSVANILRERVRDTDLAARLGGDEFALLLPETPPEGAEVLAIDIVQAVRELSVEPGAAVTASVGIACSSGLAGERDEESLLVAADDAMYEVKRAGRDGYALSRS